MTRMSHRMTAAWLLALSSALTSCAPGANEADLDATVDARVAATLSAGEAASPMPAQPDQPIAVAAGEGPTLAGCPVFPADHAWNTPVDSLPVHPRSDAYIASIGRDIGLHPDFGGGLWEGEPIGIPYTIVDGSQVAPAQIDFYYPDESDPGPYPIPPDPFVEGGGDRHILILDTSDCQLVEIYDASREGQGWSAGSGAIWDLNAYALRPETWTSADAAGLPILPGLVRYDEVAAGEIRHALRFTAEATQQAYVWPARHFASDVTDPDVPPMGQRFRLKASFDISGYPPEVQAILRAMQIYGLILADNGADWFVSGAPDPRWDDEQLVEAFRSVHGSDFEAVDTSGMMLDPDSGQARQH